MGRLLIVLNGDPWMGGDKFKDLWNYLRELEGNRLPKKIFTSAPILEKNKDSFADKSLFTVEDLTFEKSMAHVMSCVEDEILWLPKGVFKEWNRMFSDPLTEKSEAFCLEVEEQGEVSRRWSLQKNFYISLPAIEEDSKCGEKIEAIFSEKREAIEKSVIDFFHGMDEEEAPHKIRVGARTLRSLLTFLEPRLRKGKGRDKLRIDLKDLALDFSRIRELDVLMEFSKDYGEKHPESLKNVPGLIAAYSEVRREEVRQLLNEMVLGGSLDRIRRIREGVEGVTPVADPRLPSYINEAYYNDWIRFLVACRNHDYGDVEDTHRLRKQAKALRYVLENFGKWIPSVDDGMTEHLKEVQTTLGTLCDYRVNQELFREFEEQKEGENFRSDLDVLLEYNRQEEAILLEKIQEEEWTS